MRKGDAQDRPIRRWLAISLLVPREFGEAITNFLIEQGATGVEEVDESSESMRLRTYFPQDREEKKALIALRQYLKSLRVMNPGMPCVRIETTSIPEQDWGRNWKRFFRPLQVTPRIVVKPPWSSIRPKTGQISIDIYPGMAFGTGTHATTKLCIRALETSFKKKGLSVLDVGTGSGILSIVAARLGAGEVLGLDTDGVAVDVARENVRENKVSGIVKIREGSLGSARKTFDVVVANIDLKGLRKMRRPLLRHLKNKGLLILSGILEGEKESVCQYYIETGLLKWIKTTREEEWVCLTFRQK